MVQGRTLDLSNSQIIKSSNSVSHKTFKPSNGADNETYKRLQPLKHRNVKPSNAAAP